MNTEPLNCPFCDGEITLQQGHANITFFLCDRCGAVTSFRPNLKGSAALAAWNRRHVSEGEAA